MASPEEFTMNGDDRAEGRVDESLTANALVLTGC